MALDPGPTDAERAADLKTRLRAAMESACEVMNEGKAHGLTINFNVSPNAFGAWTVYDVTAVKPL